MLTNQDKAKLRRLMELRTKRDEVKEAAAKAEADYRDFEAEVWASFDEGGMSSLPNVDLGPPWGKVSFNAVATPYAKVLNAQEAMDWLRSQHLTQALTAPKVVMARANEIVRERLEAGDTTMPPGFGYTRKRYMRITRQKD